MKNFSISIFLGLIITIAWLIFWTSNANAYWECSKYGYMAQFDSFSNTCKCSYGYVFADDMFWNSSCVSMDQFCTNKYGYWAKEKWGACVCRYGYALEKTYSGLQCKMQFCWLYASFDDDSKQCVCNDWYTQDTSYTSTFTCRQKAYSTYAIINEVNWNDASVTYYDPYWIINYSKIKSYNCYKMKNYIWEKSVLNFLYDKTLNYWDYLILPNEDVCDIVSVKKVDKNESIWTCGNNSISIDGKCSCISWYTWEYPDDSKNFDCKIKSIILTPDQSCQVSFWVYAISVWEDKCNCKSGYKWTVDKKSCEPEPIYTTPTKTTKKLTCKKWELIRNGKCVNLKTLK